MQKKKKKPKVSVVDHDWVGIKWSKSHPWLNRAARRLLIFPTLEAEMLGFLYVQRSVCVSTTLQMPRAVMDGVFRFLHHGLDNIGN